MDSIMQPLEGISPDTPLVADLLDASGRVLLQCGTPLSAPLLESLKRRGIVCAPVATPENGANAVAFEERETALRGHVAHLFRLAGDDASAVRLKQLILAHRLRKLSGNGHAP